MREGAKHRTAVSFGRLCGGAISPTLAAAAARRFSHTNPGPGILQSCGMPPRTPRADARVSHPAKKQDIQKHWRKQKGTERSNGSGAVWLRGRRRSGERQIMITPRTLAACHRRQAKALCVLFVTPSEPELSETTLQLRTIGPNPASVISSGTAAEKERRSDGSFAEETEPTPHSCEREPHSDSSPSRNQSLSEDEFRLSGKTWGLVRGRHCRIGISNLWNLERFSITVSSGRVASTVRSRAMNISEVARVAKKSIRRRPGPGSRSQFPKVPELRYRSRDQIVLP